MSVLSRGFLRIGSTKLFGCVVAVSGILTGMAAAAVRSSCGPFEDVSDPGFCPFVLEAFYLGVTTGTTPTTFSPNDPTTRLQAAAFVSRAVDTVLRRASKRAALGQFWTSRSTARTTGLADGAVWLKSDGTDLWIAENLDGFVFRVRGSDGRMLETWTGAPQACDVLPARSQIFVTGSGNPGKLYVINPAENGPVQVGSTNLGVGACAIAFDGDAIWTANPGATPNLGTGGSVSLIGVSYPELNPMPWTAFTVTTGFKTPNAVIYDGTNIWVSDYGAGAIFRMNKTGSILQTVTFAFPGRPTFDGTNLWVPGGGGVVVVRASTGAILTTLTGFGLQPIAAAFDGERVLVTSGNVWLWKAADLSFLGTFDSLQGARGVCSDGQDFWVTTDFEPWLARF